MSRKEFHRQLEANGNDWSRVKEILSAMRRQEIQPNLTTYNLARRCAISPCARRQLLDEMHRFNVTPSHRTYSEAMSGNLHQGLDNSALELFDLMRRKDVKPKRSTYQAALRACAQGGLIDRGRKLYEEMRSRGYASETDLYFACQKASILATYREAMTLCVNRKQGGRAEHAFELLESMDAEGLDVDMVCCRQAIHACRKDERPEDALEVIRIIQRQGVTPCFRTYIAAINCQHISHAVQLVHEMVAAGTANMFAITAAMRVCINQGGPEHALNLFLNMRCTSVQLDSIAYRTAIAASQQAFQPAIALSLCQEMIASGCKPDICAVTTAIRAATQLRYFHVVNQLLHVRLGLCKGKRARLRF